MEQAGSRQGAQGQKGEQKDKAKGRAKGRATRYSCYLPLPLQKQRGSGAGGSRQGAGALSLEPVLPLALLPLLPRLAHVDIPLENSRRHGDRGRNSANSANSPWANGPAPGLPRQRHLQREPIATRRGERLLLGVFESRMAAERVCERVSWDRSPRAAVYILRHCRSSCGQGRAVVPARYTRTMPP